jgi:signal transduction histidine kinase
MTTLPELKIPRELLESWREIQQPSVIHTAERCLKVNGAFLELFGLMREDRAEDRFMAEFISPWSPYRLRMGVRQALGRRFDGSSFDAEVVSCPFCVVDHDLVYQSIIKDISRLKSWEDRMLQSERLTAMGKLSGEIAHEINNPLGGILLYANLIREDIPAGHEAEKNLEKIIKLATKCRIIAKGLLDFGRSSSRGYAPVDLNHVIHEMFSLIGEQHIFSGVKTKFQLDDGLPHLVGDRGQLEQVVLNLMMNAAEAMEGKGELVVTTRSTRKPPKIQLLVEDSGPGIPEESRVKIFEPFFTTKRSGEGTGLGLSITHGIVQRHGGRISVETGSLGGALFTVSLPLDNAGMDR